MKQFVSLAVSVVLLVSTVAPSLAAPVNICSNQKSECEPAPTCTKIADGVQLSEETYPTPVRFQFKESTKLEGTIGPWLNGSNRAYDIQDQLSLADRSNLIIVVERWKRHNDNTKFDILQQFSASEAEKVDVDQNTGAINVLISLSDGDIQETVYRVYAMSKLDGVTVRTQHTDIFYNEPLLHGLIEVYPNENINDEDPFIIKSKWFYGDRELDRCQVHNVKWFVNGTEKANEHFDPWLFKYNAEPYKIEMEQFALSTTKTIKFETTADILADTNGNLLSYEPEDGSKLQRVSGRLAITAVISNSDPSQQKDPSGNGNGNCSPTCNNGERYCCRGGGCDTGLNGWFGFFTIILAVAASVLGTRKLYQ